MGMRACRKCGKTFEFNKFPLAGVIKGKLYRRHVCYKCRYKQIILRKKRLTKWIRQLKRKLKCSKCRNSDCRVLDFHHVKGNKKFNISDLALMGLSKKRVLKEIKKCIVLCANCHRIEHYKTRGLKKAQILTMIWAV